MSNDQSGENFDSQRVVRGVCENSEIAWIAILYGILVCIIYSPMMFGLVNTVMNAICLPSVCTRSCYNMFGLFIHSVILGFLILCSFELFENIDEILTDSWFKTSDPPTACEKGWVAFQLALLACIMFSPFMFGLTHSLLGKFFCIEICSDNCPTMIGRLIHGLVYALIVYCLLLPKETA